MISPAPTAELEPALPAPEPCVLCEQDAAGNWLLCLECASRIGEAMLAELAQKYNRLQSWLPRAEAALDLMAPTDPRRIQGQASWQKKLRISERIEDMDNVVRAGS